MHGKREKISKNGGGKTTLTKRDFLSQRKIKFSNIWHDYTNLNLARTRYPPQSNKPHMDQNGFSSRYIMRASRNFKTQPEQQSNSSP